MESTLGRRVLAAFFILGFLLSAVVLLWSDRAGALLGDVADVVIRTGRRVEAKYDVDVVDRSDIPGETDQIVHAFFWGSGMLLIGWILRRRVPLLLTALLVSGISLVFELAQPLLSQSRAVEPTDAVANLVGITAATVFLAGSLWLVRRIYGEDREFANLS